MSNLSSATPGDPPFVAQLDRDRERADHKRNVAVSRPLQGALDWGSDIRVAWLFAASSGSRRGIVERIGKDRNSGLPKKPAAESGWERTCASTRVATRRAEDISRIRQSLDGVRPSPILTVVVPTFNESPNVPVLVERVAAALDGIEWELVFVDDNSPDATSAVAKELGRHDSRVRCIRRVGRRGLSGACLEGALSSQAEFVAVMDADLQHDERLLPQMLSELVHGKADLVIASRYVSGGGANGLSSSRQSISRVATQWDAASSASPYTTP